MSDNKTDKETLIKRSVVHGHCNYLTLKFSVNVKEQQDKLHRTHWLPSFIKLYIKFDVSLI